MNKADNTFEFLVEYISAKVVEWIIQDKNIRFDQKAACSYRCVV